MRIAREERQETEEKERAAQEARQAQDLRLANLQQDPEAGWRRVGELLAVRGTRHYREVVRLLGGLAVLADRDGTTSAFTARYTRFITAHRTKKRDLRAGGPGLRRPHRRHLCEGLRPPASWAAEASPGPLGTY